MATPYEVRTDILRLAKELLWDQYHIGHEEHREKYYARKDNAAQVGGVAISYEVDPIRPPTVDDVLKTATNLYSFVTDSK